MIFLMLFSHFISDEVLFHEFDHSLRGPHGFLHSSVVNFGTSDFLHCVHCNFDFRLDGR